MKTDATQKVVYGMILKRRFYELSKRDSEEKLTNFLTEMEAKGYKLDEIEDIAGIYNFTKGFPILNFFEETKYFEKRNIYFHLKSNIRHKVELLGLSKVCNSEQ